jgi:signal transduction histidine kinase
MNFLRPLCSISALTYCIFLGVFSLAHKNRSTLHVNFALYNFANAIYNTADFVFLFHSYNTALMWDKLAGIGGCMMMPCLMLFTFELIEEPSRQYKFIERVMSFTALPLCIAYVATPYFIKGLTASYRQNMMNVEIAGPLFPLFIFYVILGLGIITYRVAARYRKNERLFLKQKMRYVLLALLLGFTALCTYFLSFIWLDLPVIYYTLQALVAFTFSYAIFKHDLLPVNLAVRRFLLVAGIYLLIGIMITPIFLLSYDYVFRTHSVFFLFCLILCAGLFFSMGPFLYAQMIRRSSLFQQVDTMQLTHELKTPLSAIRNAREILARELAQLSPDTSKVQDYMKMIERNTLRLEKFVIDVLNVSRATDTFSDVINQQNVNLGILITDIVSHFPDSENRIKLFIAGSFEVEANIDALRQIFTNLIANAITASTTSNIQISIDREQEEVRIAIRDDGPGIDKEDLERIFQPFARSKNNTNSKGTGLGLAIAERWVRSHHGRIWAESDGVGKGATFFVVLPI